MPILDPLACGFAKVIIYSVIMETHGLIKNEDKPQTKYLNRVYLEYLLYLEYFQRNSFMSSTKGNIKKNFTKLKTTLLI